MTVTLVVAAADNDVIGRAGALPWHLPDDLRHFKAVTLGKPVLMGRRTYESIGRPLPGRRNLVLTRQTEHRGAADPGSGVQYVQSLEQARELARGAQELCVIGGAQLYRLALPHAGRIHLTRVHAQPTGDTFFQLPQAGVGGWQEVARSEHPADARHAYAMSFVQLERSVRT